MKRSETTEIRETLDQLRAAIAELAARVEMLEGAGTQAAGTQAAPPPLPEATAATEPPPVEAPIDEETLAAISACVAAFLGERVHIRQIRLLSSPAWAQQGRVSIQASHRLFGL